MKSYDHRKIEKKWQKEWAKKKLYKTPNPSTSSGRLRRKFYVLDMFPYPSGEGLHVGHPRGYIGTDIFSRYKRMEGFNVLHPMGFDAFGLPAEQFALKHKVHPEVAVKKNVKRFKEQLSVIGFDYDWEREVNTTDPEYYKWTQWIFLKLLEKGLAFESYEPINWCPSCKTGLANEDLENGACERCGTTVVKKPMRQWVLKITKYADRLLSDLDSLSWPESIKESQRNWIGKSEGMLFTSPVCDTDIKIETFSAHFEACFADTFVVIAPDHPLLPKLVAGVKGEKEILKKAKEITNRRESAGFESEKEIEGVFTGRYISDPLGNGNLPIWVASYALANYGTGIVKCSCHDERDFRFAKKYDIDMKPVLFPKDSELAKKVKNLEVCFTDMKDGILAAPKEFDGRVAGEIRKEMIAYLLKNKYAKRMTTYKLRDWVFSRQRYWGEPIPIIHCKDCGAVPVPEKDLPVVLPKVKSYEPTGTGESPLAAISKWVNVKCPKCYGSAKRETNTMPQWAGSSWYYLRYIDPKNKKSPFDKNKEKYWSPVDLYVGGTEHATRHLIYARFWHKFLYDIKIVNYKEPFMRLQNQGLIMASDGRKMSKRWGNVINPDDIVATYGADTLRIYEMFLGPFDQQVTWSTESIIGSRRFIEKVWRVGERVVASQKIHLKGPRTSKQALDQTFSNEFSATLHKTIKKVTEDIEKINFNTAISSMMICVNEMESASAKGFGTTSQDYKMFLQILAPFAPHITEDVWHNLGEKQSIHKSKWPKWDKKKIVEDRVVIPVSVNGKVRAQIAVTSDMNEEEIKAEAQKDHAVLKWTEGKDIKKIIYVPNRILNIVV